MRRIGVLMPGTREAHKAMMDAFAKRLGGLGWFGVRRVGARVLGLGVK